MKSTITISAVVLVHAALLSLIGCRSTSGFEDSGTENTVIYSGTASGGHAAPARSTAVAAVSTSTVTQPGTSGTATTSTPYVYTPDLTPGPTQDTSHGAVTPGTSVLPTPASDPIPAGPGKEYVVKKNESLWLIARREGISTKELSRANGLKDNAMLREGQKITIPAKGGATVAAVSADTTALAGGTVYEVKRGDVLGTIARKHGTTVAKIREANSLKNDNIRIGQKLVIPGAAAPTGTPGQPEAAPDASPVAPVTPSRGADPLAVPAGTGLVPSGGFGGFGISADSSVTVTPATEPAPATSVPADAVSVPADATSTPVNR